MGISIGTAILSTFQKGLLIWLKVRPVKTKHFYT